MGCIINGMEDKPIATGKNCTTDFLAFTLRSTFPLKYVILELGEKNIFFLILIKKIIICTLT